MSMDYLFIIILMSVLVFLSAFGLWLSVRPRRKRSNFSRLLDAWYYCWRCDMTVRDAIDRAWRGL